MRALLAGEAGNVVGDDRQRAAFGQLAIEALHFGPRIAAGKRRNAADGIGPDAALHDRPVRWLCRLNRADVDDHVAAALGQADRDFDESLANLEIEINAFARAAGDVEPADALFVEVVDQALGARDVELAVGRERRDEGGQDAVGGGEERVGHGDRVQSLDSGFQDSG